MPFRKFKDIGEVLVAFHLDYESNVFLKPNNVKAPLNLKTDIDYVIKKLPYKVSEAAIGEMILFPILKEVWRNFDDRLMLWSHKTISYSKNLGGIPDYLIAKQSKQGNIVLDKPYLAVVEAKKDDFEGGWAQCALEMYTIQQINAQPEIPIFGIVSNGDNWEFGKLEKNLLTRQPISIQLLPLDILYGTLYGIMKQCTEFL
jgi:hypothetical protein